MEEGRRQDARLGWRRKSSSTARRISWRVIPSVPYRRAPVPSTESRTSCSSNSESRKMTPAAATSRRWMARGLPSGRGRTSQPATSPSPSAHSPTKFSSSSVLLKRRSSTPLLNTGPTSVSQSSTALAHGGRNLPIKCCAAGVIPGAVRRSLGGVAL